MSIDVRWPEWMIAGVNVSLCVAAAVCFVIAIIYLWRNYSLEEIILEYQKKEKRKKEEATGSGLRIESDKITDYVTPIELFSLLGIQNAEDLSLEKQRSVQTVNMSVNSNEFSKIIHSMSAKEVFSFINRFFQDAITQIYQSGGLVESFWETGMRVLYLHDYEKAIVSAVSICELLNELGKEAEIYTNYTIGMTYENTIVGVVGDKQRMNLLVLSAESSGLSGWLQRMGDKYYARILVTDSYAELIVEFQKKFNERLLGYVYVKDTDSMMKVYDVYDGDKKEIRNHKRQTKIVFEKGVLLFTQRNYKEARQCFIEVLKTDRFDRAAKEYVFLCEEYIRNPEDGKVYIDCY